MAITMTAMTISTMTEPTTCHDMATSREPRSSSSAARSRRARNLLELSGRRRERDLHRQALHAGGAVEPVAIGTGLQDEGGVLRRRDRAAVAEHDDVLADPPRSGGGFIDRRNAILQGQRGFGADRPTGR